MSAEQWLPHSDYPGYLFNDDGVRVYSQPRVVVRRNGTKQTIPGRILKPIPDERGTKTSVYLYRNGRRKNVRPHHLAAELFGRPEGSQGQKTTRGNHHNADTR